MTLAEQYKRLKTRVGGNREQVQYEDTFGMPKEEWYHVTMPNGWIRRVLAEVEFSIRLSETLGGKFDGDIGNALAYLTKRMDEDGVLTREACEKGEALLLPLEKAAKEYELILAAHAHIDMNWMWGWHETVASTVATFQTMLRLMDEYPDFHFSQSQASVYKIIEKYAPELKAPIQKRIREGRWEVTASAWVETDKNMPSTESLLNHIEYTKKYLQESWDIDPDTLSIDFSPDTFGHSANLPELDALGGVKYYYHCRGLDGDNALYRWRAPSGREMIVYREQHWYNSGITPRPAITLPDVAKRSGGLKTGLVVYGVGDHGGGPTRRDLDRALEMMEWPVFPRMHFGTFAEFYALAETVREKLPVVDHELNFIMPGCYTTQSRLKMANRHSEAALFDAELWNTFAASENALGYSEKQFEEAWQSVLFTHFHDILTGSCVQDSREHAMGEFTNAMAFANTRASLSMQALAEKIDTTAFPKGDRDGGQSFGAGAGYGVGVFGGPPAPERGAGINRIYHLFNASSEKRRTAAEITVWDWTGDLRQARFYGVNGEGIRHQLLDTELQSYWDHKYFRVLVEAEIPAFGYTTVQLREEELSEYPVYLQNSVRTHKPFDNYVLENDAVRAEFSAENAGLLSLIDKKTGEELLQADQSGGLRYIETERMSSNAWNIGRYERVESVFETEKITKISGALVNGIEVTQRFKQSSAKLRILLPDGAKSLSVTLDVDWNEQSAHAGAVPVLTYFIPLKAADSYLYDVPGGAQKRGAMRMDVPGLQYGAAVYGSRAAALVSDSKYGYRAMADGLCCTLINATYSPDPYPERGEHHIELHVLLTDGCAKTLTEEAFALNHKIAYQSGSVHGGTLPAEKSFLTASLGTAILSGVVMRDDCMLARLYETCGKETAVCLTPAFAVRGAALCDLMGKNETALPVESGAVKLTLPANGSAVVKIMRAVKSE